MDSDRQIVSCHPLHNWADHSKNKKFKKFRDQAKQGVSTGVFKGDKFKDRPYFILSIVDYSFTVFQPEDREESF